MKNNLIPNFFISVLIMSLPIKSNNDLFDNQKNEISNISNFEDNQPKEDDSFEKYLANKKSKKVVQPEETIDEIVDRLIAEGIIEVNLQPVIKDIRGFFNLKNWPEIVACLINRGLDVNTWYYFEPDKYTNLLILSSLHNSSNLVELIVKKGGNVNEPIYNGWVPLLFAVGNNNKQMIEFLLNRGALINHISEDGKTALCVAVDSKSEKLVEWIIEKGADINLKNKKGNLALQCAVEYKNQKGVEILIKKGLDIKNETFALNLAIAKGELSIAQLLIESGVDVNLPDYEGITPLRVACEMFNKVWPSQFIFRTLDKIIKLLIEKNVNINANNKYPLLMFVAQDLKMVELFLQKGANPNALIEKWNISLLSYFVERDGIEQVKLLMKYGADVNLVQPLRRTALFHAKSAEMIDLLISSGADINYMDQTGATPLSSAVYSNNTKVFKALIAKDADATSGVFFGISMIELARSNENAEICELLKQYDPEGYMRFACDILRVKRMHPESLQSNQTCA